MPVGVDPWGLLCDKQHNLGLEQVLFLSFSLRVFSLSLSLSPSPSLSLSLPFPLTSRPKNDKQTNNLGTTSIERQNEQRVTGST